MSQVYSCHWILVLFALPYGIIMVTLWWIAKRALREWRDK